MKLTFFGTSHGVPMETRFNSCTVLEIGEAVYIIDGGAPVADQLVRHGIDYNRIKAVFTTHMHGDHTLGLLNFLDLASWYYKDASFDCYLTEEEGVKAFTNVIMTVSKKFDTERIRLKTSAPGCFYKDENLTVTAYPTLHFFNGQYPSYSLVIDTKEGKRVIFTGDLHWADAKDFPTVARTEPSSAIICEMAHFSHKVILPILNECPTERVFINHVYFDYEANLNAVKEAKLNMPILAVEDNDSFEI